MINDDLQYDGAGLKITENGEGCRLIPYLDGGGTPTDGYGNTHNVVMGVPITLEKAIADLTTNIQWAVRVVKEHALVRLTQGEFDALVDFVFNEGSGHFQSSTLLRLLNAGDFDGAKAQFMSWDKCGGVFSQGLFNRRTADVGEFK
jgi:lysozyme